MQNKRPIKTKYNKYHKGRISYNMPIITSLKKEKRNKLISPTSYSFSSSIVSASDSINTSFDFKFQRNTNINKITYKLIAMEPCRLTASHLTVIELGIKRKLRNMPNITITSKELENGNIVLSKKIVKPKLDILVFPHIPVTKKPAEVRMGKGKGSIDY